MGKVMVAAAQPMSFRGAEEKRNLQAALDMIKEASQKGARVICFPEGFPGPYNGPADWSGVDEICRLSRECGTYTIFGMVDPHEDLKDVFYLSLKVATPEGKIAGIYYRMQPNQKEVDWVLMRKTIAPGEEFFTLDTDFGRIGLLICSEIWCAELPRILALRGVDILFAPIGGLVYELAEAWRCLLWARAIENHLYVVTSQNLYGMEDGMASITGPEKLLGELKEPGLLVRELDIDRLKWLREHDQRLALPKPYKSIPGMLKYRRPEKYGELTEPRSETYDFYSFRSAGS